MVPPPAVIVLSSALTTSIPVNRFPNKVAPKVPDKISFFSFFFFFFWITASVAAAVAAVNSNGIKILLAKV